ncbi:MAG: helix-turn-helix transcriptional regulator, partial [Actinobacteria bacterium]|nr:helix-turn-helix transcriptional regulator [Actinomycetota bacterium]
MNRAVGGRKPARATTRRRGRVSRDPDGTRRALVETALGLFEAHGYAGTPVQRIVDQAGLTKGAFYHHFETKEDLLYEIHDEFIDDQLSRAREVM